MEEIKAGDIMLGNYIQSPYGNYPIAEIGYKDDDAYIRQKDCHAGYYLSYCRPIPLTEDILLKCGFEKDQFNFWTFTNDERYIIRNVDDMFVFIFSQNKLSSISISTIEYLHQLQNLFKALTGNELEVNL